MNDLKDNLLDGGTWLRLLLMIGFWIVRMLVVWIIGFIAVVQFLFVLITGELNEKLQDAGSMLGLYHLQITDFLTFVTENRPFPFDDFPEVQERSVQVDTSI